MKNRKNYTKTERNKIHLQYFSVEVSIVHTLYVPLGTYLQGEICQWIKRLTTEGQKHPDSELTL